MSSEKKTPMDSPTSEVRLVWPSVVLWILLLLVAVVAVWLVQAGLLTLPAASDAPTDRAARLRELAEHNADFAHYLDEARKKTHWTAAKAILDQVETNEAEYRRLLQDIESEFQRLEMTDAGAHIASNANLVRQYAALKERERPTVEERDKVSAAVNQLREVCDAALRDRSVIIDQEPAYANMVSSVAAKAEENRKQAQVDRDSLTALIEEAARHPLSREPLGTVLARYLEERDLQFLKRLADDGDKLRQSKLSTAREKELVAERALLDAEQRLRSAEAEARTERAKAIVQEAQAKLTAEKAREARFAKFNAEFPKMQPFLAPFISRGKMHLDKKLNWSEGEPAPLSLSAMRAHPSYANRPVGSDRDWGIFFSAERSPNDRPRGSFPVKIYNNYDVFTRVHSFIVEFGDVMVERGLLLP